MLFLFSLYFKVFLPGEYKNVYIRKQLKNVGNIDCSHSYTIKDDKFTDIPDRNSYFYCNNEKGFLTFKNVECSSITTGHTGDNDDKNDGRLILVHKVNINIEQCQFNNNHFYYNLIYGRGDLNNNIHDFEFKMKHCNVNNCIQTGKFTTLINSEYSNTEILNNTVYYDPDKNIDINIRAFLVHINTGCTFSGNKVVNAKNRLHQRNEKDDHVEDSSGFLTYISKTDKQFVFTDNTFINCNGVNPSVVNLQNISHFLTIKNLTFENLQNSQGREGYLFFIVGIDDCHGLKLQDCVFRNIECDSKAGGGIGLLFRRDEDLTLEYDNCVFENIVHTNTTIGGGAIGFSNENSNRRTHVTVKNCKFENITNLSEDSKLSGKGGAIYFDCEGYMISIEGSTFKNTSANQYYAIYISSTVLDNNEYTRHNTQITITNNTFDFIEGKGYGRCIYVNSDESQLAFSNCTFQNCPSGGNLVILNFPKTIKSLTVKNSRFIHIEQSNPLPLIFFSVFGENPSLKFDGCWFEGNHCPGNGGAVYYNVPLISFFFTKCTFIDNTADGSGGALFIYNSAGVEIKGCTFRGNNGEQGGGCIFIEQTNSPIEISGCKFDKSSEPKSINAIAFNDTNTLSVSICDCTFTDCSVKEYLIDIPANVKLVLFEYNTIEFSETNGCGGINIHQTDQNYPINIKYITFKSTAVKPALNLFSTIANAQITIEYCIFESCKSENYSLNFDICTTIFNFQNNIVRNFNCINEQSYIGRITIHDDNDKLTLNNISFIDNRCSSLFGGGTGLKMLSINEMLFNVNFIGNEARQSTTTSRPSTSEIQYYNGDGGGIQLGYIYWMSSIKLLTFSGCVFERNKASRHGGAIAIQPIVKVVIDHCQFTENQANCKFDSSSELLENHFHKKKDGRGGAIYINTNYNYDADSPDVPSAGKGNLESIAISYCTFTGNNGYDGYAIYVEGDYSETTFDIKDNQFIDNYNPNNHKSDPNVIYGAVIATEIETITEKSLESNQFTYKSDITVHKLLLVNHYGNTPSVYFSESNDFSFSKDFTKSDMFSATDQFTETKRFSLTDKFTESNDFSASGKFRPSSMFTESNDFTASGKFSFTNYFSATEDFTYTSKFTESNDFSASEEFHSFYILTQSDYFSASEKFSKSSDFSASVKFTFSNMFSESEELFISHSSAESSSSSAESSSSATNSEKIVFTVPDDNDNVNPNNEMKSKSTKLPMIFGIVIGILVVIIIILLVIYITNRKKIKTKSENNSNELSAAENDNNSSSNKEISVTVSIESENPLFNPSDNDPFDKEFEE